ncbi:MAG TPA: phosphotransferase family protein [Terriglobales bacterium]|nr:phosphotransferase family protein [Terriglobales bacterium]
MAKLDAEALAAALRLPPGASIAGLQRMSGGASQETWAFDIVRGEQREPRILRRAVGDRQGSSLGGPAIDLATEAELIRRAAQAGVPVPEVTQVLNPADGLGAGFVMTRIDGETIPRKILREPRLAPARSRLARQCGEIAAHIHAIPLACLPELPRSGATAQLDQLGAIYDAFDHPHPVFEIALRWLRDHAPPQDRTALVHGDFRNGNLIVAEEGVRAVLDWELSHLGDPLEDLGWICVGSWRFGANDRPVGGFGQREELFAGYQAAGGGAVDAEVVRYWEIFGTLKWGIICMMMYGAYRSGLDRSVERAAIGRRASETELDLLALLTPRGNAEPEA